MVSAPQLYKYLLLYNVCFDKINTYILFQYIVSTSISVFIYILDEGGEGGGAGVQNTLKTFHEL